MEYERLTSLMNDEEFCEALIDVLCGELDSDEEPFHKKGRYLIKAFLDGSVDDTLIAICGWSLETLIEKAIARLAINNEKSK